MSNIVRFRQGVVTRLFPHQGNERFLVGSHAPAAAPGAIAPAAGALAGGTVAVAYGPIAMTITGPGAPEHYALAGGALPPGITLSDAGVIAGTPTLAGAYAFTVRAFNALWARQVNYTLTVAP